MRKRIKGICMLAALVFVMAGCSNKKEAKEIALITYQEDTQQSGYAKEIWSGISSYTTQNNVKAGNYEVTRSAKEDVKKVIQTSIEDGAKIVFCEGDIFEVPIYELQKEYKKVKFVLYDGIVRDEQALDTTIRDNTLVVQFKEQEAGFLAGYAAVKEGYKKLGFMGGPKRPEVQAYGSGFVQGAAYASKELGYTSGSVNIQYTYVKDQQLSPAHMGRAMKWFENGCEVIYHASGKIDPSLLMAAKKFENKKIITSDFGQAEDSDYIITSAIKNLQKITLEILNQYKKGTFKGGEKWNLGINEDGVTLQIEKSKLNTLSIEDYEAFIASFKESKVKIHKKDIALGEAKLEDDVVTVTYEE